MTYLTDQSVFLQGKGRRLYLQRRGQKRPEEKFDFPLLSSWEYGWRLGECRSAAPGTASQSSPE